MDLGAINNLQARDSVMAHGRKPNTGLKDESVVPAILDCRENRSGRSLGYVARGASERLAELNDGTFTFSNLARTASTH